MVRLKKIITIISVVSLLSTTSSAFAADGTARDVFIDALYGAAVGGLIGAAMLAFKDKPSDHLEYIAYGSSLGVLAGATYGFVKSARAFAEVENGGVKFAFPTIIPELLSSPSTGRTSVAWKADFIRGTFF